MTSMQSGIPRGGYLTDHLHGDQWRKAVKFPEGDLDYFENYDIVVEGITYQKPERIDAENIVLVPANEEIAWNSKIGVYGSNGSEASVTLFLDGTEVRPFGGKIDNSSSTTHIVFEGGSVTRYNNYEAVISGSKYTDLPKNPEKNSIDLTIKIDESEGVVLSGLNDRSIPITVFEQDSTPKPVQGFVIFHGDTSTCIMFRKGDLREYAKGYKLYYENTFTTTSINLEPIHIRFESVGKNIYTEVSLVALDENGQDHETLFQGRYNEQNKRDKG